MSEVLLRVTASGPRPFCAGLVLKDGRVVRAAPILRYLVGADELRVERWVRKNRLKLEVVDDGRRASRLASGDP